MYYEDFACVLNRKINDGQRNEQKSFGNNNDHNESHIFSHTVP